MGLRDKARGAWRALLRLDEIWTVWTLVVPKPLVMAIVGGVTAVIAYFSDAPPHEIIIAALAAAVLILLVVNLAVVARKRLVKPTPLDVSDRIFVQAEVLQDGDRRVDGMWSLLFCACIMNGREDGATLRNVQLRLHLFGEPMLMIARGPNPRATDIRHGEVAYFEVGRTLCGNGNGMPSHDPREVTAEEIDRAKAAANEGQFMLSMSLAEPHAIRHITQLKNHPFNMIAVVSADDTLSRAFEICVDLSNQDDPGRMLSVELK